MARKHEIRMLELSDAFPDDRTPEAERTRRVADAAVVLAYAIPFDIEYYNRAEIYN